MGIRRTLRSRPRLAQRAVRLSAAGAAAVVVLPLSATSAAADQRTLEGVVRTLATDVLQATGATPGTTNLKDVYRTVLVVDDRKTYLIRGRRVRLEPNTRVRATGSVDGNAFEPTSSTTLAQAAGLPASGTTRVLVMLAHWTSPDAVTPERARAQFFTDSNGWYRDASYGALGQAGDVTPWMRIAGPTTGCRADFADLMWQAKSAARGLGYDVSAYDNFVLYFPWCGGDASNAAGWAYVGAPGTWLHGHMDRRVTVHEEGHNYGLWHSHSHMCSSGGLSGSCSFSDYGDPYDAMGSSGYVGHFNASQKTLLGWMSGRAVDLSGGGTTTLAPMAGTSGGPRAAYAWTGSGRRYWLEYRQPTGYDSWLPLDGTDGVLVHVSGSGSGSPDTGANLIDVRPGDGISPYSATLWSGMCWRSPEGVRFSIGSVTASGAAVAVRNDGSVCDTAAPMVTARTPAADASSVSPATTVTATFNEEMQGVSATTFTLRNNASGAAVSASVSREGSTNRWVLDPLADLAPNTSYSATLQGGMRQIRDAASNPLPTTRWSFRTAAGTTVTNLVVNPSFESSLAGWGPVQATLARTAYSGAPQGGYVAKATWARGTSFAISDSDGGGRPTVGSTTAGRTYIATAAVRAAASASVAKPVQIILRERNTSGVMVKETRTSAALGNAFTTVAVAATAAGSGNTLGVRLVQHDAASGHAFYVDLVTVRAAGTVMGTSAAGATWTAMTAGAKRVSRLSFTTPATVDLAQLRAYVDGRAATSGTQPVRAIIYADASGAPGALLARSSEAVITAGRAAGWVTFDLPTPVRLRAGTFWLGLHSGGATVVGRFASSAVSGALRRNSDSYSDGASNPFGTPTSDNLQMSVQAIGA